MECFAAPALPEAIARTFRFHLLHAVWDAAAGGVLSGLYSLWQEIREGRDNNLATIVGFEARFVDTP